MWWMTAQIYEQVELIDRTHVTDIKGVFIQNPIGQHQIRSSLLSQQKSLLQLK
jgi:hypothetical protein